MRKNEIIKKLDEKIKKVETWTEFNEAYKLGLIGGLELAKNVVKEFKRRQNQPFIKINKLEKRIK